MCLGICNSRHVVRTQPKPIASHLSRVSSPPYPFSHSGPCIVAGAAWNLHNDLARAWEDFGLDTPVIAVNGAAREVRALALFSAHPHRFECGGYEWARHQRRLFGRGFTVHGARDRGHRIVDFWWGPMPGGGGSAWGARKVAAWMGFNPVLLCGCPLKPGSYAGYRPSGIMSKEEVTEQYASEIEADSDWHESAYSYSGRTMEILGLP